MLFHGLGTFLQIPHNQPLSLRGKQNPRILQWWPHVYDEAQRHVEQAAHFGDMREAVGRHVVCFCHLLPQSCPDVHNAACMYTRLATDASLTPLRYPPSNPWRGTNLRSAGCAQHFDNTCTSRLTVAYQCAAVLAHCVWFGVVTHYNASTFRSKFGP